MNLLTAIANQDDKKYYLTKTTFINKIESKELRDQLVELYNSEELVSRALASVLNAIYTQKSATFFLSKKSLEKLIESDSKNLNYKSRKGIKTTEYKEAYAKIFIFFESQKFFTVISKYSMKDKKPSCIKLADQEIIFKMGTEFNDKFLLEQHQDAINVLSNIYKPYKKTAIFKEFLPDNNTSNNKYTPRQDGKCFASKKKKDKIQIEYVKKDSPWYQHFLKSSYIEGIFKSLSDEVQQQLFWKTVALKNELDGTEIKDWFVERVKELGAITSPISSVNVEVDDI